MTHKTLGSKFAGQGLFINVGLCLASLLFCVQFAAGYRQPTEAAFLSPAIAFGASAIFAGYATSRKVRANSLIGASVLPFFFMMNLAAGNQRPWVWVMLCLTSVAWLVLVLLRHRDIYDADADRIDLNLR